MVNSATCRAARGLLNWSQQQLADAAHVGLSTVKKFEAGHSVPLANNLSAIRHALENAGVEFVPEEDGGPGVLARRLRFRAYIPGEGLHIELRHTDLKLEGPDNNFDLWFKVEDRALAFLAGRPIIDEADAKRVATKNQANLIEAARKNIVIKGLKSPGGGPRMILIEDFV